MNPKEAIKQVIDTASDRDLIAIIAALRHPSECELGRSFCCLAQDIAKRIETKVGEVDKSG